LIIAVALLARGEIDDLRYAGTAIIALPYEDRDALRAAADYLEVSKPVVRHTGKEKAQWLKPGLSRGYVGSADLPQFAFSREVPGTGPEVFAAADAMGLEGIVSKDVMSPYRSGPGSWA
jgi:ATP-dependent DNA ligase